MKFHVYEEMSKDELRIWTFACVYDSRYMTKREAQLFIERKMVVMTQIFRDVDDSWKYGGFHACQEEFASILYQRMQEVNKMGKDAFPEDNLELSRQIVKANRNLLDLHNQRFLAKQAAEEEVLIRKMDELNREVEKANEKTVVQDSGDNCSSSFVVEIPNHVGLNSNVGGLRILTSTGTLETIASSIEMGQNQDESFEGVQKGGNETENIEKPLDISDSSNTSCSTDNQEEDDQMDEDELRLESIRDEKVDMLDVNELHDEVAEESLPCPLHEANYLMPTTGKTLKNFNWVDDMLDRLKREDLQKEEICMNEEGRVQHNSKIDDNDTSASTDQKQGNEVGNLGKLFDKSETSVTTCCTKNQENDQMDEAVSRFVNLSNEKADVLNVNNLQYGVSLLRSLNETSLPHAKADLLENDELQDGDSVLGPLDELGLPEEKANELEVAMCWRILCWIFLTRQMTQSPQTWKSPMNSDCIEDIIDQLEREALQQEEISKIKDGRAQLNSNNG